ncbi:RidA family protein [Paraburkholderia sacchari]|uniref:Rid family hydrolase n=1 Tax=Paraburkholderia sacchari TaxID=159450 RepID=UPI0039A591BC
MPNFKMSSPGAIGEYQETNFHYALISEVNGRVETSGQGGHHPETLKYDDTIPLEQEIDRAFEANTFLLESVGLDWSRVINVFTYHVVEPDGTLSRATQEVIRQFQKRFPDHKPTWTALGVAALGDPKMRVEVRVVAIRP